MAHRAEAGAPAGAGDVAGGPHLWPARQPGGGPGLYADLCQGFDLPAAFAKHKKPGRREYLRARIREGQVEVFKSEGSGRISGLSWAEGLVELADGGAEIQPGELVRYIPYSAFNL